MKKQLQPKSMLKAKLLSLLTIGLISSAAMAQFSGTYTIDNGSAASTTNFQNWASFWQSLQGLTRDDGGTTLTGGVSGAVTVNVITDQTETKQVQFPVISGTSSTNKITINGNGKFISFPGPAEVISFTGGDWFVIQNLKILNTATSNVIGIRFSNTSDNNTIDKCTIEFNSITAGTTSGSAYIAFANSSTALTSATTSTPGSFNTISANTMRTTNSNSPGPTAGITMMGNTSTYTSTAINNTITGNTIENFYYLGIYTYYGNGFQVLNNDISRKNSSSYNSYSVMYPLYVSYTYSTNRSVRMDGNNIHDLPYAGVSVGNGPGTFYGIISQYNYGTSTYRFSCSNNNMARVTGSSSFYLNYSIYNQYYDFIGNTFDACTCPQNTSGSAYFYGSYNYGSLNYRMNQNTIKNCSGGYYFYGLRNLYANSGSTQADMIGNTITGNSKGYYYTYLLEVQYPYNTAAYPINITDNVITDNSCDYYYMYCLYPYFYGNYNISRNTIMRNKNASSLGYVFAIYNYYNYEVKMNSNLIAENAGYYGTYGIYSYFGNSPAPYAVEIKQNTIHIDGSKSTYTYHYAYALMVYNYYNNSIVVQGNIIITEKSYGAYPAITYSYYTPSPYNWDYNSYFYQNVSYIYFQTSSGSASDFNGWKSLGVCGKNEYFGPPNFVSPGTGDYRSNVFENQNNVPTTTSVPKDITGANRNPIKSDRGARESFMDIKAVSTNFSVPSTVCAGYSISGGTTITVQNLYSPDTAYNFNVAYSINGGGKVTQLVSSKMLYNGTATVTFTQGLVLNKVGLNRIAIFIDIPDDNVLNDSFIFTTTVKPAPGGGKFNFSTKPTWAFYQYGKLNDVTVVNQPVFYDVNSPRAYTNSDYGSKWTASVAVETAGGSPVTGATITPPVGSTDMELKYVTSNVGLEDEMLTFKLKITDLTNGCDTILIRKLLIYPTIVPDFTYPSKICDGDAVSFDNKSTVKSGNMEFYWDFGTGNVNDNTDAPNPVFQFPTTGNYKVKMTAKTLPYGFPAWDSAIVNVGPIPTVKFGKVNACEGKAIVFTNMTTPTNASYEWDFGAGGAKSYVTNPTTTYAKAGAYTVTLRANLNGCIGETSQRVYQFDKPKAGFTKVSGNCDNEAFSFDNTSSIAGGLFGNNWDFNDGTVSTEDDPMHTFTSFGTKNVKLVTTSEFGCKDSITKPVAVKESPVADFVNDPACSLSPTQFTNTTADVSGAVANYAWDFGDGQTSAAKSPSHSWSALGPKNVMLTVMLDNGCKSSFGKTLTVGVQPDANFSAENVCAGNPVVFENNTAWAQGKIDFEWDFGDNTKSTNSDPQKTYTTNVTTTYNVTLKANIQGGCSDQVTKQVTVNEAPQTCDFIATPDYAFGFYGMKLEPKNAAGGVGAQTGVSYTWVFDGGGTETGPFTQYNFQEDGTYKVTMRAKVLATGCECTKTMDVVMNRKAVKDLTETGVAVYPNPNNGQFQVALTESFGKEVTVTITSMTGQVVKVEKAMNNGLLSINAGDLADGVYTVVVSSGDRVATAKITIQN